MKRLIEGTIYFLMLFLAIANSQFPDSVKINDSTAEIVGEADITEDSTLCQGSLADLVIDFPEERDIIVGGIDVVDGSVIYRLLARTNINYLFQEISKQLEEQGWLFVRTRKDNQAETALPLLGRQRVFANAKTGVFICTRRDSTQSKELVVELESIGSSFLYVLSLGFQEDIQAQDGTSSLNSQHNTVSEARKP